ncbi:MAG: sodium:proton antiporter, partial [Lachnospiraceae bacterium]|nr:sodium:proton antiporter [Lachnospiraceae bacterium]
MKIITRIVFIPMIAAILSYLLGRQDKKKRNFFAIIITGVTFLLCILCVPVLNDIEPGAVYTLPGVCGMGMHFTLDGFRALYGTVAAFMWFMTTLFSGEYFGHYRNRNRYYLFLLMTLG